MYANKHRTPPSYAPKLTPPDDAARASANVRSHLPGAEKEAKTGGEVLAADAEKAYKDAASQAKDATSKVDAKLEDYRKEAESKLEGARKSTGDELTKAVDKFDKSVEEVSLACSFAAVVEGPAVEGSPGALDHYCGTRDTLDTDCSSLSTIDRAILSHQDLRTTANANTTTRAQARPRAASPAGLAASKRLPDGAHEPRNKNLQITPDIISNSNRPTGVLGQEAG